MRLVSEKVYGKKSNKLFLERRFTCTCSEKVLKCVVDIARSGKVVRNEADAKRLLRLKVNEAHGSCAAAEDEMSEDEEDAADGGGGGPPPPPPLAQVSPRVLRDHEADGARAVVARYGRHAPIHVVVGGVGLFQVAT